MPPPRFPRAAATSGGVGVPGAEKLQGEWRRGLKGEACVGGGRANEAHGVGTRRETKRRTPRAHFTREVSVFEGSPARHIFF